MVRKKAVVEGPINDHAEKDCQEEEVENEIRMKDLPNVMYLWIVKQVARLARTHQLSRLASRWCLWMRTVVVVRGRVTTSAKRCSDAARKPHSHAVSAGRIVGSRRVIRRPRDLRHRCIDQANCRSRVALKLSAKNRISGHFTQKCVFPSDGNCV